MEVADGGAEEARSLCPASGEPELPGRCEARSSLYKGMTQLTGRVRAASVAIAKGGGHFVQITLADSEISPVTDSLHSIPSSRIL